MAKKRDKASEIAEIRSRTATNRLSEIEDRLEVLEGTLARHRDDPEFLRYLPVAIVTTIEVHTKISIRTLIDSDEKFALRAEPLAQTIKFDLSLIHAVRGTKVSFGEIVAHSITARTLSDIDWCMSVLVDRNFLDALRITTDRYWHGLKKDADQLLLDTPDETFAQLNELFPLRHIIVHELPKEVAITSEKVSGYLNAAKQYVRAANALIEQDIRGSVLEFFDRYQKRIDEIADETERLCRLAIRSITDYLSTRAKDDLLASLYRKADRRWNSYVKAELEWLSKFLADDPVHESVILGHASTINRARTQLLLDCLNERETLDDWNEAQ